MLYTTPKFMPIITYVHFVFALAVVLIKRIALNITIYGREHGHSFWHGRSYIPVLLATWRFFLE